MRLFFSMNGGHRYLGVWVKILGFGGMGKNFRVCGYAFYLFES